MSEKYLVTVGDTFGIEARLREIDDGYRVFYNKVKKRFEIHNVKNQPNTLVLVSPFDELDARIIKLVRRTSVSRADEIYREIEEHNDKLMKKQMEEEKERAIGESRRVDIMKSLLEKRR